MDRHDDVLGSLDFDDLDEVFVAQVGSSDGVIELLLEAPDEELSEAVKSAAEGIAKDPDAWLDQLKRSVIADMYDDAVEWHQIAVNQGIADTDKEISKETFVHSLKLDALNVSERGIYGFIGSEFICGGHVIQVLVPLSGGEPEFGIA